MYSTPIASELPILKKYLLGSFFLVDRESIDALVKSSTLVITPKLSREEISNGISSISQ